jgi:serine/threonine-protein kinase
MLEGLCPGCLLDTALGPPPSFPEGRFGDYQLLEEIAHGGTGVIYRARQDSLDRVVALKMLMGGELASAAEMRRVRDEAKTAASLKHPNIVPIYEVGMHEEIAYFTMPLMEGGSLAEQLPRFQGRFQEAARLLETIARAVHHGHQRGILHRDLKPANVLLDAAGVPYVADFGLARALDPEAEGKQTGLVEGTLSYMALEQAQPGGAPLTVAADVYSLGVILYELLTGQLPFEAESFDRLLALLREGKPLAPRAIHPRIPRDMEAICLQCLEKEPARRYGSAAELADDLRRFLEGRPVIARPAGLLERAWMWHLRHPLGAGLLATLLWALLVAAGGAVRITRELKEELSNEALRANVYAAPLVAAAVLRELEQYGKSVSAVAAQPGLASALQAHDEVALESFCKKNLTYYDQARGSPSDSSAGSPFDRCFILDANGFTRALWPIPKPPDRNFLHVEYAWRDYFKGALHQARKETPAAYISRALVSESNDRFTFALSVPVYGADGTLHGVVVATVASDSTLGSLRLNKSGASNRTTTLVALMDRSRQEKNKPLATDLYAVMVHDDLKRGTPHFLEKNLARQLEQALSRPIPVGSEQPQRSSFEGRVLKGYRDPVSGEPGLAAFAPVGDTGFVVIVQTQEQAVLAVNARLATSIAWWSVPLALGIGLVWLVLWISRNRSLGKL